MPTKQSETNSNATSNALEEEYKVQEGKEGLNNNIVTVSSVKINDTIPLSLKLTSDVISGVASSFMLAPFVTILDRSIIKNANGSQTLGLALKEGFKELFTKPYQFFLKRDFRLIWGLYLGTYLTANCVETTVKHMQGDDVNTSTVQLSKFFATSLVNISLSVRKDMIFTKMFANSAVIKGPAKVPLLSTLLFTTRDCMTIAAGFNLPKIASEYLQVRYGFTKNFSDVSTQLTLPLAIQLLSTPLHLLGLDLFNNRNATSSQRTALIVKKYVPTAAARIGRMFPAYGIGGVMNTYLRKQIVTSLAVFGKNPNTINL
ncbi:hypothetical protein ABK040_000973 [Willaertia magna]